MSRTRQQISRNTTSMLSRQITPLPWTVFLLKTRYFTILQRQPTIVGFDNVGELKYFLFFVKYEIVSCDLQTSLTESDILYTLPDKKTTLDVMTVTKILSDRGTKSLGDFEVQYIFDPDAKRIVQE